MATNPMTVESCLEAPLLHDERKALDDHTRQEEGIVIDIITEGHPKDARQANARESISRALEDYYPESAEHALVIGVLYTLKKQALAGEEE